MAQAESKLPEQKVQELTEMSPDHISAWVESLNAWRVSQHLAS
jgi:hypothetical protein